MAAAAVVAWLMGCVSLTVDDQLLLYRGSGVGGTVEADCAGRWQERSLGPGESAALDPSGFGVMTWNVYKAQAERWSEDFARLSAGQDLVLLQEAHLTPPFLSALTGSGFQWLMVRAFDYRGAETGVLTAGKVPASAACLDRTREPLIRVPKSALLTRYPLGGSTDVLWIANLHGVNFTLGTEQFHYQLKTLAKVLKPHGGPLILAGDFNDWNQDRSRILRAIAAKLGLVALALPDDRRSRHFGSPVDHIFYRGLEVMDAGSAEVESSDHNPVFARFRMPGDARTGREQ